MVWSERGVEVGEGREEVMRVENGREEDGVGSESGGGGGGGGGGIRRRRCRGLHSTGTKSRSRRHLWNNNLTYTTHSH